MRSCRRRADSPGSRAPLRGRQPGRLCETYLRMEVARLALAALVGMPYREHDRGWRVDDAIAEVDALGNTGSIGGADDLNVRARLHGRTLVVVGTSGPPNAAWRDAALAVDPRETVLAEAFPWDRRSGVLAPTNTAPSPSA